jgi:hypothetical protein
VDQLKQSRKKRALAVPRRGTGNVVEWMEPRLLLSAASAKAHLFLIESAGPFASPTVDPLLGKNAPFTPNDIRNFYGVNGITFGSTAATGAGETIAIVDAYSQPNLLPTGSAGFNTSDLHVFDTEFGLPDPPSFIKLNENGGIILPTVYDSGWALETSLDVEWAHAMAPQANIVLIEANSNSFGDLFSGVSIARSYPGVVAVSMSWGDTEADIGSAAAEIANDSNFTTPTGHAPITFIASTGDAGASRTDYPSLSPNVLAVGGTSIVASDFSADYGSESVWNDQYGATGGNISTFEPKPGFQSTVTQSSTFRTVPDVSFNADPVSGVYVLDTTQTPAGYYEVGGTSLGSPAWAGLIADADQGRALIGLPSLNGATQTLPRIYQLSANDFHDVTSGSNAGFSASAGYDLTTGRGTPITNLLIPDLVGGATVSGQIFQDNNADGIHDGLDAGLGNQVVYLDLNGNGIFDANDPTTTTNSAGFYTFTDQVGSPGASVKLASPAGLIATDPVTFTSSFNSTSTVNIGFFPTAYSDSTPNDSYVLRISPSTSSQIQILVNNVVTDSAPLTLLPSLSFTLSGAGESLAVDGINGNPIPTGGVSDSDGTLSVLGSAGNDSITFNAGSITFGTGLINYSNVSSLSVDPRGGSDTLAVNAGAVTIPAGTPNGGILLRQFASLSIAAGASLAITSPVVHTDRTVLVAANLSVNSAGQLNLGGNDLIAQNGNFALLTSLLASGFNGALWNGNGIASSAAQNDSSHMTALGIILNSTTLGTPIYTTFDGVAVTKTSVLIKYTYYGDANLDGAINGDDYTEIDNGFNEQLTGWSNGDFNYSGSINGTDYTLLDNAFNSAVPPL